MIWVAAAYASSVQGGGVTFVWSVQDGVLTGEARAATSGWVAVGLSARPGLAGSVLILGSARPDGTSAVVEHVARPPRHPDRVADGGARGLLSGEAEERNGTTIVRFQWKIDAADGWTQGLAPGAPVYFTLAWSREDDFEHHSAQRVEVPSVL